MSKATTSKAITSKALTRVGLIAVAISLGVLATLLVVTSRSAEVVGPRVAGATEATPALVAGDWPATTTTTGPTTTGPTTTGPTTTGPTTTGPTTTGPTTTGPTTTGPTTTGPTTTAPPPTVHPSSFTVADAIGSRVELFSAPDGPRTESMDNPTWEGLAMVFLVLDRTDDWLQVRVSRRPNGMVAWVRAADVALRTVPNWIKVEIGAKRVTVFHADTPLVSATVATGKSATPTPTGSFFVDGVVPLSPPHRAYGAGQVSVSAFSPTLESFGGGIGQIALHGTFATGLLGQETSNGCVRMDNHSISTVMDLAPTGTPVEIVA